jgi:predicted solute-binding protein
MLTNADAALIIGDPALRIDPTEEAYAWLDLGAEWLTLTGLPMVFAAWAGKQGLDVGKVERITTGSYQFGQSRIDEIVEHEYQRRGVTKGLAKRYLTQHIRYELGADERRGLEAFIELARLAPAPAGNVRS